MPQEFARDENAVIEDPPQAKRKAFGTSFVLFALIACMAGVLCYTKGEETFSNGLHASWSMLVDMVPRLIGAFLLAGFFEVLVPRGLIKKWIGQESGLKGIVVATLAGFLTPGGPMISFPLLATLYKLGANFGPLVSYLLSWELIGIMRLVVWEVPLMGMKFVLLRVSVSLVLPILAGLMAQKLVSHLGRFLKVKEG